MLFRKFLASIVVAGLFTQAGWPADPKHIPDEQFDKIYKMIKRQDGEWSWAEIPWTISLRDAQKKAAAEGKPIFVSVAAQGSMCGGL